jgi:hypothetical protein
MRKRRAQGESPDDGTGSAHRDHAVAQEEHELWLRDLRRWRQEYQAAVFRFVHRHLDELELANFEAALDRHEAAILAHQQLVDNHERRLRLERRGLAEHPEEVDELHEQMHDRHDASRHQHQELARSHRAIVKALEMLGSETRR